MELLAFNSLWQSPPPICSVKGTIGHCLGAAGIIESCLSLKSLQTGHLPPTVGLCHPEDNGSSILSGTDMLQLQNQSILSCNSGFGGINAALLFEEKFD
jgi:3-oxoacyl-(acyl-carrier-protein) synthase